MWTTYWAPLWIIFENNVINEVKKGSWHKKQIFFSLKISRSANIKGKIANGAQRGACYYFLYIFLKIIFIKGFQVVP